MLISFLGPITPSSNMVCDSKVLGTLTRCSLRDVDEQTKENVVLWFNHGARTGESARAVFDTSARFSISEIYYASIYFEKNS